MESKTSYAKVRCTVSKHMHYFPRRKATYQARPDGCETSGHGATPADALAALATEIGDMLRDRAAPTIMADLLDGGLWVAAPDPYAPGWSYHRLYPVEGMLGRYRQGSGMGVWSRDECLSHMRAHWYANNVKGIVDGIVALCSDRRLVECRACKTVFEAHVPYRCVNPGCGA